MIKGLEALEALKQENDYLKFNHVPKQYRYDDELDIIEKELKALEIIRKYFYDGGCLFGEMTREEFEFVKEVLL